MPLPSFLRPLVDFLDCIREGTTSAFSEMLAMKAYINAIVMNTPNHPNLRWQDGKFEVVVLNGIQLPLDDIRQVIADLTLRAEMMLDDLLLDQFGLSNLDYGNIRDEMPCEDNRYSFLSDPFNASLVETRYDLMQRILEEDAGEMCCGVMNDDILWDNARIQAYMGLAHDFLVCMAALVHLTYGGPARGEEFVKVKLANDVDGARHLFWDVDCFVIITSYHKGSNLLGWDKVIPRYLPAHVSDILRAYVHLVRPVEIELASVLYPDTCLPRCKAEDGGNYLWWSLGRRWTGQNVSAALQAAFKPLSHELKLSTWRQIQVAISKVFRLDWNTQDGDDQAEDLQAAHSTRTSFMRYAINSEGLGSLDLTAMLQFKQVSQEWQVVMGCLKHPRSSDNPSIPRPLGNVRQSDNSHEVMLELANFQDYLKTFTAGLPPVPQLLDEMREIKDLIKANDHKLQQLQEKVDMDRASVPRNRTSRLSPMSFSLVPTETSLAPSAMVVPPSHSPFSSPQHLTPSPPSPTSSPCRSLYPPPQLTPPTTTQLSRILPSWSTSIIMTRHSTPSLAADSSSPVSVITSPTRLWPISRITICQPKISDVDPSLLKTARMILGQPSANWKCPEQALAAHLVSNQDRQHLLLVLPTGAGKTLAYLVANRSTDGGKGMVVIVPLQALLEDLLERLLVAGCWAMRWSKDASLSRGCIVLVPAETAITTDFLDWGIFHQHNLARIVLEEVHIMLTSTSYRPDMQFMRKIRTIPVPLLLVSATLPITLREPLFDHFGINSCHVFHPPNARPEMKFYIHPQICHRSVIDKAVEIDEHLKAQVLSTTGKSLYFCQQIQTCRKLAEKVNGLVYHSKDKEGKGKSLETFKTTPGSVMCSTTALGAGVDLENIEAVIIVGTPTSFLDLAQELGRGGRSGKP